MLNHLSLLIILFLICSTGKAQDTVQVIVYYDIDADTPSASEYAKLDRIIKNDQEIREVILTGHTDSDGSDAYNHDLAKRRVMNVKNYLKSKYSVTISVDNFGEAQPIVSNLEEAHKWQNRRVEVLIIYKRDLTTPPVVSIDSVYKVLSVQEQHLEFNNDSDTIVVLEKGTVFILEENTFPEASGKVMMSVKEVYSCVDMIGEGLTTTSNGRRLQTGGMLKLEAYDASGNPILPEKPITVMMPTESASTNMKLFFGERNAQEEMNWNLANDELHTGENSSDMLFVPGTDFTPPDSNGLIPPIRKEKWRIGRWFSELWAGLFFFQGQAKRTGVPRNIGEGPTTQELMDSLGVESYEELKEVLIKERLQKGQSSAEEIGYYAFRSTTLGWVNCDEFLEEKNLITMLTDVSYERETMTRLVFKKQRCIFPANHRGMKYVFKNVPGGAPVYHVIIKTEGEKVLLSIVETVVGSSAPSPEFEEIALSQLKARLKDLEP